MNPLRVSTFSHSARTPLGICVDCTNDWNPRAALSLIYEVTFRPRCSLEIL